MKQEKQRDKSGRRFPAWLREWVLPALLVVAIVLPVRAFAVDWMPVQGDSHEKHAPGRRVHAGHQV